MSFLKMAGVPQETPVFDHAPVVPAPMPVVTLRGLAGIGQKNAAG